MSFPIPEPFCWDESFKVFYENLDEQHKGLFNGIFEVAGNRADAGKLKSLYDKVVSHFKTEEQMMQAKNYPNFTDHKTAHDDFVGKLGAVKNPVDDATIDFAKNWLVNHIKGIDFKYKGKL